MNDEAVDLERLKVQLDERRLDFEIRQYEDANEQRTAALEKLREEVADLKRPFFKKPTYLTPAATIVVALVTGGIAFFTDFLNHNVIKQINLNHQLQASNQRLESQKKVLTEQIAALNTRVRVESLRARLIEYRRDIERRNQALDLKEDSIQDLLQRAKLGGINSPEVALITAFHDEKETRSPLRSILSWILYKATNSSEWKQRLRKDVLEAVLPRAEWGGFSRDDITGFLARFLTDQSIFNPGERMEMATQIYLATQKHPSGEGSSRMYWFYRQDINLLVKFRDPWIDHARYLREHIDQASHPWGTGLLHVPSTLDVLDFSHQAFAILTMQMFVHDPTVGLIEVQLGPLSHEGCPAPKDVPICAKFTPAYDNGNIDDYESPSVFLDPKLVPAYTQWLGTNPKITRLFSFTGKTQLFRDLPDDVFRKIIEDTWVSETEL